MRTPGAATLAATSGVLVPVVTWVSILTAGALRPGYDHVRQYVSELAVGPTGSIVTAGFYAVAVLTAVFAAASARTLGGGGLAWTAAGLLGVRAIATAVFAFFPGDPDPLQRTAAGQLHNAFVGLSTLSFVAALLVLAARYRRSGWKDLAAYALATSVATLALFGMLVTLTPQGTGRADAPLSALAGLIQRSSIAAASLWFLVTGYAYQRRAGPERTAVS